jgi:hypothetical protein
MQAQMRQRGMMGLAGALCGMGLYGLSVVLESAALPEMVALVLSVAAAVFAAGFLAMVGPLSMARAALSALGLGVVVAGLLLVGALRFGGVEDYLSSVHPILAAVALTILPLPFLMAGGAGAGWRHYPALFGESWAMVVRALAALVFTATVWAMIGLSDLLLGLAGLRLIGPLLDIGPVPWVITGAALGLSLAVVTELSGVLSPVLVLRLLRLLILPVLAVLVLFLIALPVNGLAGFGGLSAAATLLAITAACATLVTTAVERDGTDAVQGALMSRAAQALALLLPLPPLLALYALWLRIDDRGLTPERLLALTLALIGLGYGLAYAGSVLRGSRWMERIRRANVTMALVTLGLAALWLAVFPAEAISARDQVARLTSGRTAPADLDLAAFDRWGRAGAAARAEVEALAKTPGQEALAAVLAGETVPTPDPEVDALRADLVAAMPLQPPGAEATRDLLLPAVDPATLADWLAACRESFDEGRPGCVFVVGDFLPRWPGEEALVVTRSGSGWVDMTGLALGDDGAPRYMTVASLTGLLPDTTERPDLLKRLQDAPPALTPAPVNRIDMGGPETGIVLLP